MAGREGAARWDFRDLNREPVALPPLVGHPQPQKEQISRRVVVVARVTISWIRSTPFWAQLMDRFAVDDRRSSICRDVGRAEYKGGRPQRPVRVTGFRPVE